jgi:3-oxoacyl-[acyl-carrier protein] reductase
MRTCLVVGGFGAIGSATIEWLGARGWTCLRTSSQQRQGGDVVRLDLTQPGGFGDAVRSLPELDGVVVCAGLEPQRSLRELEEQHVRRMLDVHVSGPMLLLRELAPKMREGSAVVLFSSVAATNGSYDPAYATAKGAVVALGRTLSREWAPSTRVNTVAPGLVEDTPVFHSMTDDFRRRHLEATPLGRLAGADECASAVEFLLTHPHLTGVVLHVDGGLYRG